MSSQNEIDYTAQQRPFERLRELVAGLSDVFRPDPRPTDPLDELERVREEGRVWVLEQKGKGQ